MSEGWVMGSGVRGGVGEGWVGRMILSHVVLSDDVHLCHITIHYVYRMVVTVYTLIVIPLHCRSPLPCLPAALVGGAGVRRHPQPSTPRPTLTHHHNHHHSNNNNHHRRCDRGMRA